MEINAGITIGLQGFFRLFTTRDGIVTQDTGFFPNLITDQGLDWFGTVPPNFNVSNSQQLLGTHCGVGVGNTTPAFTDTQLTSFTAMFPTTSGSNVEGYTSSTYVAGPPSYWSVTKTYTFATGAVVANIAEVGVGNTASADTQPKLFSHALILDGGGNPTTLPVTGADALTVVYEFRQYLDTTDNTYSMSIGATNYTGTYRRANINTPVSFLLQNIGYDINNTNWARLNAFSGTIGPITGQPAGTNLGLDTGRSKVAYISGTYFWSFSNTFNTATANGTIASFLTTNTVTGNYQFSISPSLVKTSSFTLTINWNVSWIRFP